ncbi:MAG: hypothetical protein QOC87_335, partial [Actinomycetota bacterium]|nr:hypothetical protein [Actinomycetota bacterium]
MAVKAWEPSPSEVNTANADEPVFIYPHGSATGFRIVV